MNSTQISVTQRCINKLKDLYDYIKDHSDDKYIDVPEWNNHTCIRIMFKKPVPVCGDQSHSFSERDSEEIIGISLGCVEFGFSNHPGPIEIALVGNTQRLAYIDNMGYNFMNGMLSFYEYQEYLDEIMRICKFFEANQVLYQSG
jgi:hypothetical protein